MTGTVIQSRQTQAEQARQPGPVFAQNENLVIRNYSEEGVENTYQEMVALALDVCSHTPGVSSIESLIVPQARVHQMPSISARLSFTTKLYSAKLIG